MKQQILSKLAEINALQTSYNAKYAELLALVQSLPDETVNTPSFRDRFMKFYKGTPYEKPAGDCYDAMVISLKKFGIYSDLVLAYILATARVEVGKSFDPKTRENMNYSAERLLQVFPKYFTIQEAQSYAYQPEKIANKVYANRLGNGDEKSGDGWKFRGNSLPQLTGRTNHRLYTPIVGFDLEQYPEKLNELQIACDVMAWFFKTNGLDKLANAKDTIALRKKYNGGTNGLTEFTSVINQYLS